MGIRNSIRNFFYAATHANQLIAESEQLRTDNQTLNGRLWKAEDTQRETAATLEAVKQHRDKLTSAMKIVTLKNLSQDTLRDLYNAAYNSPCEYERAGEHLLGHYWQARRYFQEDAIWNRIESEVYRSALTSANILPQGYVDASAINYLRDRAIKAIDAKFDYEQLSADMPAGRIDYLQPAESIEYRNAGEFVSQIMHSNWYGEPMSITVYSDPKTGTHINTSWILDMDPPPQSFQITPYHETPQTELVQNTPVPAPAPEFEF